MSAPTTGASARTLPCALKTRMMPTDDLETSVTDGPVSDGSETKPPVTDRRRFLALGAAAAGLAVTTSAGAQSFKSPGPGPRTPKPVPNTGLPADAALKWKDPVLRLVRRITSGLSAAEVASARQMGFAAYLDYQLKPNSIDNTAVDTFVNTNYPFLAMPYATMVAQDSTEVNNQLMDGALYRAAFSKRQLLERMVDFWDRSLHDQSEQSWYSQGHRRSRRHSSKRPRQISRPLARNIQEPGDARVSRSESEAAFRRPIRTTRAK